MRDDVPKTRGPSKTGGQRLVRQGSPDRARSQAESIQPLGITGPEERLDVTPEIDRIDPELVESAWLAFVEQAPITGSPKAHLRPRPREIDQVDAIGLERIHDVEQERVSVQVRRGEISEVPVRPLSRISARTGPEQEEEV